MPRRSAKPRDLSWLGVAISITLLIAFWTMLLASPTASLHNHTYRVCLYAVLVVSGMLDAVIGFLIFNRRP